MTAIDNLTDQSDQLTQVILPDGSVLQIELLFMAAIERWILNVSHPLLVTQGITLADFPNLLRSWRNLVPFGVACQTVSGQDPVNVEDFVNGNAALYALDAADVQAVEQTVFGGVLQ